MHGSSDTVQLLLDRGADPNAAIKVSITDTLTYPLHRIRELDTIIYVSLLIKYIPICAVCSVSSDLYFMKKQ
jgi:uncharacterized membrane protein